MIPLLYPYNSYSTYEAAQGDWLPDSPLSLPEMEGVEPIPAIAKIEGTPTPFYLYLYQNRIFFHIANQRDVLWATLYEKPADLELEHWWQGEVAANRIGRFLRYYHQFSFNTLKHPMPYERHGALALHYYPMQLWVIIAQDESLLVREWCTTRWHSLPSTQESTQQQVSEISPRGRTIPSIWRRHRRFPRLRSRIAHGLSDEICFHHLSPEELAYGRIEWKQGEVHELENLLKAWLCLRTVAVTGKPIPRINAHLQASPHGRFEIRTYPLLVGLMFPRQWVAALEREFQIRGFTWRPPNFEQEFHRTNPQFHNLRLFWSLEYFQLRLMGPLLNEISAHDQLEAHQTLVQWLRPRVSPGEVEFLLQEAQKPLPNSR